MRQCPKCQRWMLEFDNYFGRFRCFGCGWITMSSTERQRRLLHSYEVPIVLDRLRLKAPDLSVVVCYEPLNDALVFDFDIGPTESTFDLPEPDGLMVWRIGRHTGSVAGFVLFGVKKLEITNVKVNLVARMTSIQKGFQRVPSTLSTERVTQLLIEEMFVTADARREVQTPADDEFASLFSTAMKKIKEMAITTQPA